MIASKRSVSDAISVERVSKRFRLITIARHTTLKETLVGLQLGWRERSARRYIQAVDDVSFSVPRGSTLGIIGKNGSGKSTLMRLLAGIYTPDKGLVRVAGAVVPLLSLGIGFHAEMTGRENLKIGGLILGLTPREVESKADEIIDFAELREFIDVPVRTYSSGMYVRLAFAVAVSVDPDVLLLDEVLAVGDEAFSAKCLRRIEKFKEQRKTIVLVTHDPELASAFCDTVLWMDRGRLRLHGPAPEVVAAYHAEQGR